MGQGKVGLEEGRAVVLTQQELDGGPDDPYWAINAVGIPATFFVILKP